ncbi:hypothetical protein HYC85_013645 [Camellia sinensis]|uniref:Uncharacterized protein n=1 Tax=Camellia sinensis TaxID=4442 RepID=A0A7J7H7H2_CAMSI|nr:hypothetical protein HYC85_013645 [Camellia sinensis]
MLRQCVLFKRLIKKANEKEMMMILLLPLMKDSAVLVNSHQRPRAKRVRKKNPRNISQQTLSYYSIFY